MNLSKNFSPSWMAGLINSDDQKRCQAKFIKEDIVKKWIDFFVLNKEVKAETINEKLG